ncbi:ATP-binding protein [Fusobacterium nucleatum]|uniref:Chromosome segregation protein SMC n=1 Tax=Fusobacterium nucleatum subsp. polymorphum TaxID=76857 RepID=A0A2C6AZ37_FUSNP|nr:ATP-binding protein [Fusobacterium polymorphum]PHH97292.1 chromosome segregation protein SMC [Fusobacterium polymorphum]
MLIEFKVEGFKNFEKELVFDLSKTRNYNFNENAIKNDIVKTGLIYGINGSGKSNLGLAIFDIILHLTDKEKNINLYNYYLNLSNSNIMTKFSYKFKFGNDILEYEYKKNKPQNLLDEVVKINNKLISEYNYLANESELNLKGTENLNKNLNGNNISFIKYINNNTNPEIDTEQYKIKEIISKFINFVDSMLLFSSLDGNFYQGFKKGGGSLSEEIINRGKLKDFENFLREGGIDYIFFEKEIGKEKRIYCKFNGGEVDFFEIASRGTKSLALFYAWLIRLNEASFVFIDEFDAFYHVNLAKIIVKELLKLNIQAILTTHDTTIMTNDLLRPDCYFVLSEGKIKSLSDLTEKELRQAHNLEKMYRAGAFNE